MESREIPNQEPKSEFEGGNSRILYLAPVGGFRIKNERSLTRRDELSIKFPASGINQANKEESEFQRAQNEKAKSEGKNRNVNPLRSPDFKPKVGILNLRQEGNTLVFDTKPNTFPMYNDDKNVGIAKPENQDLRDELGAPVGTAIILLTTEGNGKRKMIIQHRSKENRNYRDIVGASAAGFLDQEINKLNDTNPATLKIVDEDLIKSIASKETEEEDGIDPQHLTSITITGIAEDLKRRHYEMLLMAQVDLSAEEVEKSAVEKKSIQRAAFDFSESFFVIDATPKAIKTLLTEVKCPIPSTHGDAFVAAGRLMVLERDGEEAAKKWTKELEVEVKINNAEIDRLANDSTGKNQGYNPKLTPQEQGLPDIVSELKRVGLIEHDKSNEAEKTAERAWFFDCDGPLSDPSAKKITTEGLAAVIGEKIIDAGEIASINTGRSISWLFDHGVVGEIENAISDKSKLSDIILVGEKGGTWATFENGKWVTNIDESIKVPDTMQNEVRQLVESEFSDIMFFDESKLTMISVEMHDGHNVEDFKNRQGELNQRLKEIIEKDKYKELGLKLDPSAIATDIQNGHVGKHFGAQRILDWMTSKGIEAEHFITIGDSDSDADMADELHTQGKSVEFVFVGKDGALKRENPPYPIRFTNSKNGEGTLEFIRSVHQ